MSPCALGKIAVVGSGAVGGYYGARLAQSGEDVHFLMRSDLEVVRKQGFQIESVHGSFSLDPVNAYGSTREIGPCDLVVISLKATSNDLLLPLLEPLVTDRTRILTLQNGLGNGTLLARAFGAGRVLGGLCFVCINRRGPGVIDHLAQGLVTIGEQSGPARDRTRNIAAAFKSAGIPSRAIGNLAAERWKKLVWNIPFNGLAIAAGGLDTAQILADPDLRNRTRSLMAEVVQAAARQGLVIPEETIDLMIERTGTMGGYRPSSLIDFEAGAAVEVEAIWGEPLRRAQAAGADVPEIARLHAEIVAAVERRS